MELKMNARITVDSAGRILLPEPLREELHLGPGDTLSWKVPARKSL